MRNVLFVDDEKSILTAIRRSFKKEDMTLFFASSAKEALELMEEVSIQVIVADLGMPEMDGIALFKEVGQRWSKVVKIALTGKNELEDVVEVFDTIELYKYVTKPWIPGDLITYINEGLEHYRISS